ncbi:fibrillin-2-like isoform X2 [Acanthaster planci]|uniref:Fibrillin-2-like isoform X2 n=1 Tax=Acanthaster planci TaxID=133434 RepID=A0A8B7ZGX3_ACAPL|nr:fibrillin-2-like isoform X2 [Acanthaster planci]
MHLMLNFLAVLLISIGIGPQVESVSLRCGSHMYAGSGTLTSPNYPGQYPADAECAWQISTDEGNHVSLTFNSFELEESTDCRYDYLVIFDGADDTATVIGRYCGQQTPRTVTSTASKLHVKFVSDSSIERLGFHANFSTGCSRNLAGPRGQLTSPNYPGYYPINQNCLYKITVGNGKRIRLQFLIFATEGTPSFCSYDTLEIFDGTTTDSKLIGRYCGTDIPDPVITSGNEMMMRFLSDNSVGHQGFYIEFEEVDTDFAPSNPCLVDNGGCDQLCEIRHGKSHCRCRVGYKMSKNKVNCVDRNECASDDRCAQICVNTEGSYHCECQRGYHLAANAWACVDVDECRVGNGGCQEVCRNIIGSYTCECATPGSELLADGRSCGVKANCRVNNGGCNHVCHEKYNGRYCSCHIGFLLAEDGFNCTDIDECQHEGGIGIMGHHCNQLCINTPGSYYCDCNEGFVLSPNGRVCKDIDECATELSNQCHHSCINFPGGFRCECFQGFNPQYTAGATRCVDIDECDPQPEDCHTCNNFDGGFECLCRAGFIQNENQTGCLDINECLENNGDCQHVCVNLPGSHECRCRVGYQGTTYTNRVCVDIDECAADRRGPCDHACTNTEGSFECTCDVGFYLQENMLRCEDIDECVGDNGGCSQRCYNTLGSWECGCFDGYFQEEPDVDYCVDVDECMATDFRAHRCAAEENAVCSNVEGNYTCLCPPGYMTHEWFHCKDVDECQNEMLHQCQQDCINVEGGFHCGCFEGYFMINETHCDDINECDQELCDHNDLCVNAVGSFTCGCRQGYFLMADGQSCSDVNECNDNNGGCAHICINDRGGHRCECNEGFELQRDGRSCEDINECDSNFACCNQMNNCLNLQGSYTCSCDPGYFMSADNCTCLDINECEKDNGGCSQICTNFPGHYNCSCEPGFEAMPGDQKLCFDIDECQHENGGCDHYCTNFVGGYNCSCEPNFKLGIDSHSCQHCPTCENFEEMQMMILGLRETVATMQNAILEVQAQNRQLWERIRAIEDQQNENSALATHKLTVQKLPHQPKTLARHSLPVN